VPKAVGSHADDAAFLASSYGLSPDEWQFNVLEAWLGETRAGKWAAGRCGLAVPRQNGKNALLEIRELYGIIALGEKALHTAHEVKTARKAFVRLASFFENERAYPELAALVQEIRRTNGQEAIVLKNGGSVEFVARSRGSGRGYTVDLLVTDEVQELSDEQLEALLPTVSAAPSGNPQIIMTGTPPGPNSVGEVFTRTRDLGVSGKDKRLAWHEWSVPEGAVDVRDRNLWAATNPALGARLNLLVIEDELAAMSPEGFARERLGQWSSVSASALIGRPTWAALRSEAPPVEGRVTYGVKFSQDGATVALATCLNPPRGGVPHVEVVEYRSTSAGMGWLVDWLVERHRKAVQIVVDGQAGQGALTSALADRGVPDRVVWTMRVPQVIAAHAVFYEAVRTKKLTHFGQSPLDKAVASAEKRPIGSSGGWGWRATTPEADVTPLDAVTLAHYGAVTSKRRPDRKAQVMV
jgi:hypothetical protein